jgi:hypothetical protein
MGGNERAASPPFGSLLPGPPNGLERTVAWLAAGLSITEHPR